MILVYCAMTIKKEEAELVHLIKYMHSIDKMGYANYLYSFSLINILQVGQDVDLFPFNCTLTCIY